MSAPSTFPNNSEPRRRSWLWIVLTGVAIVAIVSVAVVRPNNIPTADATADPLNFADVVIADLTQEEEFNGKLESIKATGTVIPAAQIDLAFDTSGTVAELPAQVGQDVQAGDVLARLDTADLERAVAQAEISLRQAEISLEVAQEPPTEADIQAAQDAVEQSAAALNLEQISHESAMNSTLVVVSLDDAQEAYDDALRWYNFHLDRYHEAGDADYLYWYVEQALNWLEEKELELTHVQQDVNMTVQLANNNLAQASDQYNQAQAALDVLLAGADPSAIESLELQVQAASLDLEVAQENLANAALVAPFDGVVTAIAAVVGQDVGDGTPVVSLADLAQPTLEIFLGETNLDKVAVGTQVDVRFSALPAEQFSGTIVQVDPQLTVSNNYLSLLRALVQVDTNRPSDDSQGQTFPAGLTASVHVIGSSNRIARVFLSLNDEGLLDVGDPVAVELPDFSQVPGTVVFVPQDPTDSVSGPASFEVLVELANDPATSTALAGLPDETWVDVIFVSDAVTDVMAIPVTALVALLEGGYAVEKKTGPNLVQLVAVEVGFFGSDNMIAVTSDDLQPGDQVLVP